MTNVPKDAFALILQYLPDWTPHVIFDVGANIGQSARAFARYFPDATVHCFEPSPETYRLLVGAVAALPGVVTHNVALGRSDAVLSMTQNPRRPTENRLVRPDKAAPDGAVQVSVRNGADVMRDLNTPRIDYLKIDTEGHDLEVLHGFLPALDRVDFIEVEAAMNPYNKTHVPFSKLEHLLRGAGFHLVYIFEQKMEWKRGGKPVLRRSNPLFVHERLVDLDGIR